MKYDLTDEDVDRMVQSNKKLHIELAMAKVELERLKKALKDDMFTFSPERAQNGTAEALRLSLATVAANKDKLIPVIVKHFGAPNERSAISAIGMVGRVLIALEHMIRGAPIEEIKDGMTKMPPTDTTKH